jgi:hypothetical protein
MMKRGRGSWRSKRTSPSAFVVAKTFAADSLALSVPPLVDAVWQKMVLDTAMYGAYCEEQLRVFVEYSPFSADDAEEEKKKRIAKTVAFYVIVFDGAPSEDVDWIWTLHPTRGAPAAESQHKKVKTEEACCPRRRRNGA